MKPVYQWRYSSIILDLNTRWKRMVSFTSWPFYPWRFRPGTQWIWGWVSPGAGLESMEKTKILPLAGIETGQFNLQPAAVPTELSRLWYDIVNLHNFVRFGVFTAVTIKYAVFWDVAQCRSCLNRCFGGTYHLPWRWRRSAPPKSRFTQDLHGTTSPKMTFFLHNFGCKIPFW
jgi:hypothetical protein